MYWYNPTIRASERRPAPSTDAEAVEMLAGDPGSATFVTEYAEHTNSTAFRPRAIGYELLIGTAPSSRR